MKITHNVITKIKETNEGYLKVTLKLQCFSGQAPYFSVTYDLNKSKNFTDRGFISGGCNPELIAAEFPEYAHLTKWHLFGLGKGPMHYLSNSLYHASNKDHNNLLKGETRQLRDRKTGNLSWEIVAVNKTTREIKEVYLLEKYMHSEECPPSEWTLEYRPWCIVGEGKEPNLEAARSCSLWPDAELEDFTKDKLAARLPALLETFEKDMLELGLIEKD